MSRLLPVFLFAVLFLAACGGTPTPTAAPTQPAATLDPVEATDENGLLPPGVPNTLQNVAPGTMVVANDEGTPDATPRPTYTFKLISFYQQGGLTGTTVNIVLYGDGRLIRDGVESQVTPEEVDQIEAMLTQMDFMRIQGTFTSDTRASDQFLYTITVDTEFGSQTINSQDGLTPDPLLALYDALKALGQS